MTTKATQRRDPDEHKRKEKAKAKQEESSKALKQAYCETFGNGQGSKVLRDISKKCGFDQCSVIQVSTGQVDVNALIYNEARRSVYLEIRDMLTKSILIETEH